MQGGKITQSNRQEATAARGSVTTAKHLLEITALRLLHIHMKSVTGLTSIVGRTDNRKFLILEPNAFKQNTEKPRWDQPQMKEIALFIHPSKRKKGEKWDQSPAWGSTTAPESTGEVTSTTKSTDYSVANHSLNLKITSKNNQPYRNL